MKPHDCDTMQIKKDLKHIHGIEVHASRSTIFHRPERGVNIAVISRTMFGTKIDSRYIKYFELQGNNIVVKER